MRSLSRHHVRRNGEKLVPRSQLKSNMYISRKQLSTIGGLSTNHTGLLVVAALGQNQVLDDAIFQPPILPY